MRYGRRRYGRYERYGRYVSAAEKRGKAVLAVHELSRKGHAVSPVVIAGRAIAHTFWGKAWCQNLERYSDFSNRLPRGRTYARNGSVLDLQIAAGEVKALVSGSEVYRTAVEIAAVPKTRWASICADCAGAIDSLVELLQGRFSQGVMERICQQGTGLFPGPAEIKLSCSCPDWASMCKHVAAVLYAVGARLDEAPELLFKLRRVDEKDLIAKAGRGLPLSKRGPAGDRVLAYEGLAELFGLEMAAGDRGTPTAEPSRRRPRQAAVVHAAGTSREAARPKAKAGGSSARKTTAAKVRPATKKRGRSKR